MKPRDAERSKNFFALGLICWMYTRPIEPIVEWIDERFGSKPTVRRRQPRRVQGRVRTSARPPSCSTTPTRSRPRALPPGRYRNITGNLALAYGLIAAAQSGQAAARSTRRTRSRRRPTSSTSSRSTRTSACARCRPRTRSPRSASRSAPRSPGSLGVTGTSGPGVDLKSEAHRARGEPRAAAAHRRRAARRPVHRPADQDRAGRPAARDVRPPRRGAAADRRGRARRATASTPRSRRRGSR